MEQEIITKAVEQISALESNTEFVIGDYLKGYNLKKTDLFRLAILIINRLKGKIRTSKKYLNPIIGLPYLATFRTV